MLISAARNGGALLGFLQNIYKLRLECCLFANAELTNTFFSSETRPLTSTQWGFSQLNFRMSIYGDRIQSPRFTSTNTLANIWCRTQHHWLINKSYLKLTNSGKMCLHVAYHFLRLFFPDLFVFSMVGFWLPGYTSPALRQIGSKKIRRLGQRVLLIYQLNAQPVTFTRKTTIYAP